eukprot:jgi/Psemu1/286304/fgenesh1_pg.129_\
MPLVIPYGMTANTTNHQHPGCQVYRRSVLERVMAAKTAGNPLYKSGHIFHYSDQEVLHKLAGAIWIDDAVGSLLETNNLLNNTVVLFKLDHHGMETKGSCLRGAARLHSLLTIRTDSEPSAGSWTSQWRQLTLRQP